MRTCPICDCASYDNAEICSNCRHSLTENSYSPIDPDYFLNIPCPFCGKQDTILAPATVSSILCRQCGAEVWFPKLWRNWDDIIAAYSQRTDHKPEDCPFCGREISKCPYDKYNDGLERYFCQSCGAEIAFRG